ncbi:MAG TPA: glycosyltransferase family 4 protein [Anaeromyxobacteraceae bacterium]|nr:glycosyltransferase family 4 protein [Anaeromyxobacteraceae bacterium]
MKVTFFHPGFEDVGGAELLALDQAAWLRDRGVGVEVVTYALDPARWARRFEGIPVTVVPRRAWSDVVALGRPVARMRLRARRARPALQGGDVVLATNYPCSALLGWVETPARTVWQCNEPNRRVHPREANPFLSARASATAGRGLDDASVHFARRLAELARGPARREAEALATFDVASVSRLDAIFAISAFSRDNARRIYGRCSDVVVPPMVAFPAGVPPRSGLGRSGLRVLVHSRLERVKNVDTVLRGFARFRERADPAARLHVVGEGAHRPRLEALAVELGLGSSARFHGFLPDADLARVYSDSDVLACLPVDEPFGMVFPEAAARGLLLVGPDHGGPLEILEGGALGFTCDAFDPGALADVLERVAGLPDAEADRLRIAADRACRARYAPDVVGRMLLEALA